MDNEIRNIESTIFEVVDSYLKKYIENKDLAFGRSVASSTASRIATNAINQLMREIGKFESAQYKRIDWRIKKSMNEGEVSTMQTKVEDSLLTQMRSGFSFQVAVSKVAKEMGVARAIIEQVASASYLISKERDEKLRNANRNRKSICVKRD
ncbi:hypothetical protein EKK58_08415 [Candidatus Dependentiae bacterium]|nr:MAG: hypothetical protein EKK58_08415 [Candidatus Dependentiae bacterium]